MDNDEKPIRSLIRRLFARWRWTTVRDTGITRYQVNGLGHRRVQQRPGGYQPIDRHWLATGEWSPPPVPPQGTSGVTDMRMWASVARARQAAEQVRQ